MFRTNSLYLLLLALFAVAARPSLAQTPSFTIADDISSAYNGSFAALALTEDGHVLCETYPSRNAFIYTRETGATFLPSGANAPTDMNSSDFAVGGTQSHWLVGEGQLNPLMNNTIYGALINDNFQVAGNYVSGPYSPSAYFMDSAEDQGLIDLGHLGGHGTQVNGMNNHGAVAGRSVDAYSQTHAVVWTKESGLVQVELETSTQIETAAYDINDFGDVVAGSELETFLIRANGSKQQIHMPIPGTPFKAAAINNLRQVVGSYRISIYSPTEGFYWQAGQSWKLDDLVVDAPAGWTIDFAVDINHQGQILVLVNNNTTNKSGAWVLEPVHPVNGSRG